MSISLAAAAQRQGAHVTLLLGPCEAQLPAGLLVKRFVSALELDDLVRQEEVLNGGDGFDVFIAAAAVADWRPRVRSEEKIKKEGEASQLELVRTPDVLASLSKRARGWQPCPLLIGFAAETKDIERNARMKLENKRLDLVVANNVKGSAGAFGADESQLFLVTAKSSIVLPMQAKTKNAKAIVDWISDRLEFPEREQMSLETGGRS